MFNPEIKVTAFEVVDVITASGETCELDGAPGFMGTACFGV